jgi:signal transduction histidine kinase
MLRRQNRELSSKTAELNSLQDEISMLMEQRTVLDALLQMRSHQQVNVAHELRTPLAAIRGYTRMIVDGRSGEVNDTQREYLRIVTENTNRLITLVGWMSYLADLSTHHFNLSTFDFRELWAASANRIQAKLSEKSLQLVERVSNDPFVMMGDREKLAGVLDEILAVGIRLAETGGTLTAELSRGREMEVVFKLAGKGAGIAADVLGKIFDRSSNMLTKPGQADEPNAVNLCGVYDVVGMHGGRVFVNSTAGQGTTFSFTLPAITASEESSHDQTIHSGRRRR